MNRKTQRRMAWPAALLLTGILYAVVALCLDMQFAVNDDTSILRTFMGYESIIPSFHLLLHGLLTWPLKWLGEACPGVAWYSIFQIVFLAFGCVLIAKSIIQCFVNQGRSFWLGTAFAAAFLGAFCLGNCARVTFTCTAALLGAAAVLQLLSIDYREGSGAAVFGGVLLALVPAALCYALRQIALWPALGFCGVAVAYSAVRFHRPFCKNGRGLAPLLAGVLAVAAVFAGLMVWRAAEEKDHQEYLRWSNVPLIDYYDMKDLTPDMLASAGWNDTTVQMARRFCYLNPDITTESMETLVACEQSIPRTQSRLTKGASLAAGALFGAGAFRFSVYVVLALLLACAAGLLLKGGANPWRWAFLAANLLLFAACLLYLGYQGRLPQRALLTVLLPFAAALLGLLPQCLPDGRKGLAAGSVCLAVCLLFTGLYLAGSLPGWLPDQEEEDAVGNPSEALDAYALANPETLFVYDDTLVSDARMFPDVSEGIPTNVVFWGGWSFRSQASYAQFAAFDIVLDNIDPEMWLRDDICLATGVVDPPPRLMLEYLQEKVDPDVDCFLAGEDGGVYFYQFY